MKKEEKQTPHISSRHSRPESYFELKFNNSQFIRGKFPPNDFCFCLAVKNICPNPLVS